MKNLKYPVLRLHPFVSIKFASSFLDLGMCVNLIFLKQGARLLAIVVKHKRLTFEINGLSTHDADEQLRITNASKIPNFRF